MQAPEGVCVDPTDSFIAVTENYVNRVRKIDLSTVTSSVIGVGRYPRFCSIDNSGTVYFSEQLQFSKITLGGVSSVVSSGYGNAVGVAVKVDGTILYVAEGGLLIIPIDVVVMIL